MVLVFVSSKFIVNSGSNIATFLGIKESLMGATIIALGTSLPELSIALTAVKEGRSKIVLGNIIGSCLTNLSLILGLVLISSPLTIDMSIFSTLLSFVIATTIIAWYLFTTGRKLERKEGVFLLLVYIIFLMFTFGLHSTLLGFFVKVI
jgi:cation:H+ antiporter